MLFLLCCSLTFNSKAFFPLHFNCCHPHNCRDVIAGLACHHCPPRVPSFQPGLTKMQLDHVTCLNEILPVLSSLCSHFLSIKCNAMFHFCPFSGCPVLGILSPWLLMLLFGLANSSSSSKSKLQGHHCSMQCICYNSAICYLLFLTYLQVRKLRCSGVEFITQNDPQLIAKYMDQSRLTPLMTL